MTYLNRFLFAAVTLALLTGLVIWTAPQVSDVGVVAQAPNGDHIPAGTTVRVTFSRAVDRHSAEAHFTLVPVAAGRFFWADQTLTFQPQHPLAPDTNYRVVIQRGLQDDHGHANATEVQWLFRTRRAQLLLVNAATLTTSDVDGTNARTVASVPGGIGGVAVAPNGQQLVYAQQEHGRSALVLLNLADTSTRPLVDSPEMSADVPAWSPGGDMIAFERRTPVNGAFGPPHIWVAQPDGTLLGPLDTGQAITSAPAWSPTGSALAFTSAPSQTLDMFTLQSAHRSWPASAGEPATWAPTGNALAYSSSTAPGITRIQRISTTTNEPPTVLPGAIANESSPAWSPDGSWLAYIQHAASGGSTLWIMRPDGTQRQQLTAPGNYADQQPVWSPDSRQLAFIRLAPLDGSGQRAAWTVAVQEKTAQQVRTDVQQVYWLP